jgi:hypothetical protein
VSLFRQVDPPRSRFPRNSTAYDISSSEWSRKRVLGHAHKQEVFLRRIPKSYVAGAAAAIPESLHADVFLVAQSGGTMVRPNQLARHSAWFIPQRQGTGTEDRVFRPALQPHQQTFRLDGHGPSLSSAKSPDFVHVFLGRDARSYGRWSKHVMQPIWCANVHPEWLIFASPLIHRCRTTLVSQV